MEEIAVKMEGILGKNGDKNSRSTQNLFITQSGREWEKPSVFICATFCCHFAVKLAQSLNSLRAYACGLEPAKGIEPLTSRLQIAGSTIELRWLDEGSAKPMVTCENAYVNEPRVRPMLVPRAPHWII